MFNQFRYFLILFVLNAVIVKGGDDDDEEKEEYTASMSMMTSCSDFENKHINCDGLTYEPMGDAEGMKIGGFIAVKKEIDETMQCQIKITKEHEGDKEVVFGILLKVCESIDDDKAPPKPLFEALGITGCPIKVGDYPLSEDKQITINLDNFQELMTKDNEGWYSLEITCESTPPNRDSCHNVEMSISKKEE